MYQKTEEDDEPGEVQVLSEGSRNDKNASLKQSTE